MGACDLKDPRVPRLIALFEDAIRYVDVEADSLMLKLPNLGLVNRYRPPDS